MTEAEMQRVIDKMIDDQMHNYAKLLVKFYCNNERGDTYSREYRLLCVKGCFPKMEADYQFRLVDLMEIS